MKAGDKVRLNDHGLRQIFGTTLGLTHMKTLELTITWIDKVSITDTLDTFEVSVDDKGIDSYLIDHRCFDLVKP